MTWQTPKLTLSGDGCRNHVCVEDGRLHVPILTVDDQGDYTCVAGSEQGDSRKTVSLSVEVQT